MPDGTGKDHGFEQLAKDVLEYLDHVYPDKNKTFKVVSRRARKNFPLDSQEINREMGGIILDAYPEMKVDVHNPDIMLNIEIRTKINIYSEVIPGPGGMPWEPTDGHAVAVWWNRQPGSRLYGCKAWCIY